MNRYLMNYSPLPSFLDSDIRNRNNGMSLMAVGSDEDCSTDGYVCHSDGGCTGHTVCGHDGCDSDSECSNDSWCNLDSNPCSRDGADEGAPDAPTITYLEPTKLLDGIEVSWQKGSDDITGYRIIYREQGDTENYTVVDLTVEELDGKNYYTIEGLEPGKTYVVNVQAKNEDGYSGYAFAEGSGRVTIERDRPPRPDFFEWDNEKVSGEDFNVTANEWSRLQGNINEVRTWLELESYNFSYLARPGQQMDHEHYNECSRAIRSIGSDAGSYIWGKLSDGSYGIGGTHEFEAGDPIYAEALNSLRNEINAIGE